MKPPANSTKRVQGNKLAKKSDAHDEYWSFAYYRQLAFRSRATGIPFETTPDDIISKYKFTNCYRVLDRTTQHLIKEVTNVPDTCAENIFFQTILFKIFNSQKTWLRLKHQIGTIDYRDFDPDTYCAVLSTIKDLGDPIYSAAYIMPSGKKEYGSAVKHENNMQMLNLMLKSELHKRIWDLKNLREIYEEFLKIPTIGPFLAYQYAIDIAYSKFSEASEDQFVVAGPGAIRGIKKCFTNSDGKSDSYIIQMMTESQDREFTRLGLNFPFLANRKLQLIDCQNLFCEVDKYLRVKRPDLSQKPSRIKQNYKKTPGDIEFTFPSKWKNVAI